MANLQNRYRTFFAEQTEIQEEASPYAQRMLDFLRRVNPRGYVNYSLHQGYGPKAEVLLPLDRFEFKVYSPDMLYYQGPPVSLGGSPLYFFVPLACIDSPDAWEKDIEEMVNADRELVHAALSETFDNQVAPDDYSLQSFPYRRKGDERFLSVRITPKDSHDPTRHTGSEHPVFKELISGSHFLYVYDRETKLFYMDNRWNDAKTVELLSENPELAQDRLLRGDKGIGIFWGMGE